MNRRIAQKFLVRAGIFEAPPSLVEALEDFILPRWAGYVWWRCLRIRESHRADTDQLDEWARLPEDLKRKFEQDIRETRKRGENVTGEIRLTENLPPKNRPKGLWHKFHYNTQVFGDKITWFIVASGDPSSERHLAQDIPEVMRFVEEKLRENKRVLKEDPRGGDGEYPSYPYEPSIDRVLSRVRQLADRPSGGTHSKIIDVDISDWRYPENPEDAQRELSEIGYSRIYAIVEPEITNYNARWEKKAKNMRFAFGSIFDKAMEGVLDVPTLERSVEKVKSTIRHESQHVGQTILKEYLNLDRTPGTPSKSMSDDMGEDVDFFVNYLIDHDLDDREFYPVLQDSVDEFMRKAEDVPDDLYGSAIKVWTAEQRSVEGETFWELSRRWDIRPHALFETLKVNNREKWEKAVKEFYKEVS